MTRLARLLLLCAVVAAGPALTACGEKHDIRTVGETEGVYLDVGGLKYQVQISRNLNPADVEDRAYLKGVPQGVRPDDDETWFGVFVRAENTGEEPRPAAREFSIEDTQGNVYRPVEVDTDVNVFAYEPRDVPGRALLPHPDSPAGTGPIQGAALLFVLTYETLQNRPLEFHIESPEDPDVVGVVDLDV
jgi:hypothetical protein